MCVGMCAFDRMPVLKGSVVNIKVHTFFIGPPQQFFLQILIFQAHQ